MKDGWLRGLGERFFAITRPSAIWLDESGTDTLESILGDFTFKELMAMTRTLNTRVDSLQKTISALTANNGISNNSGIYIISKDDFETLVEKDAYDEFTIYAVHGEGQSPKLVTVKLRYLDKNDEVIAEEIFTDHIGSHHYFDFREEIGSQGVIYQYDRSVHPFIDTEYGTPAKCVQGEQVWLAKNATLTIQPK